MSRRTVKASPGWLADSYESTIYKPLRPGDLMIVKYEDKPEEKFLVGGTNEYPKCDACPFMLCRPARVVCGMYRRTRSGSAHKMCATLSWLNGNPFRLTFSRLDTLLEDL